VIELPPTMVAQLDSIKADASCPNDVVRIDAALQDDLARPRCAQCLEVVPARTRFGMPKNLLAYVPIDIFPVSVEDRVIKVEVD